MKNTDLIFQLSQDLKPVNPIWDYKKRFAVLMVLSFTMIGCGVYFWYLKKNEFVLPNGRTFAEVLLLISSIVICGLLATRSTSPHHAKFKLSKWSWVGLCAWTVVLLGAFALLYSTDSTTALEALKYKTWLCTVVIYSVTIPSAFVTFLFLQKGRFLFPRTTFLYIMGMSFSCGALTLAFICPWTDPLHELLWHVLPVIVGTIVLAATCSLVFRFCQKITSKSF